MMRFSVPVLLMCAVPVSAAPVPERVPDLVKTLKNGKPGERVIAAEVLGDLGPKAEGAIPALVEVIRDTPIPDPGAREWSNEERAANFLLDASWDALGRIGPKAVPALAELLAHKDAEIRGRAAAALKAIGPGAADAVPALIKRLGEGENQWVCFNALEALAAIGPKSEAAIPALIQTVLDPKATIPQRKRGAPQGPDWSQPLPLRDAAAQALAAIGPKALPGIKKDLFPGITKALDNADGEGRFLSGFMSDREQPVWVPFGEDAAPLVPAIVQYLRRHDNGWVALSLLKLGPAGPKALGEWLADKDERTRNERFTALNEEVRNRWIYGKRVDLAPVLPQLIPFLTDKDHDVRLRALVFLDMSFRNVPPELAKAALPLLDDVEFLKYRDAADQKYRHHKTDTVVGLCGPAAIPKLLKYLKSDDKELREYAVRALNGMRGPGAEALLPTWRDLATGKTKHPAIAPSTAAGLAIRISLDPKDVELLLPILKSDDAKNRAAAAYELTPLRHLARPHLKLLFTLLKDRDADVRKSAAWTINYVDPSDPEVCAALAKWITDSGDRIWLESTGPFAKEIEPAVPTVLKTLRRGDKFDPLIGTDTIRRIGPAAKDAVPLLVPYLTRERDPKARDDADLLGPDDILRTLGAIGPAAKDAVPVIRKQVTKVENWEKIWYFLCLADIGSGAKDAVPDLKEMLLDPDPRFRLLAACALSKIEADPAAYRAAFVRAIREQSDWLFGAVPFVFDRVAADCPELVPVAVRGMISQSNGVFCREYTTVMRALKRNAIAAKPALPDLVKYLDKPGGWGVRIEFIEIVGAMGPDAKAALPKLRELLDSPHFEIAIAAQEAIQKIEAKK